MGILGLNVGLLSIDGIEKISSKHTEMSMWLLTNWLVCVYAQNENTTASYWFQVAFTIIARGI